MRAVARSRSRIFYPPLPASMWATIRKHREGGAGGELVVGRRGTRPKFCSAFSSAALVVNVLGPVVDGAAMTLPGVGTFDTSTMRFEAKRTAGTKGYPPNLDLVLQPRAGEWVFVESKCLEYPRPHTTAFSFAFVQGAKELLPAQTHAVHQRSRDRLESTTDMSCWTLSSCSRTSWPRRPPPRPRVP
jgi:hypothetical protein